MNDAGSFNERRETKLLEQRNEVGDEAGQQGKMLVARLGTILVTRRSWRSLANTWGG
jgi:hypothetical protein